jgi:hypothetical protein
MPITSSGKLLCPQKERERERERVGDSPAVLKGSP